MHMLSNGEFFHVGHLLPFRPPLTLPSTDINGCLKLGSAEAALYVAFWVFLTENEWTADDHTKTSQ